MAEVFRTFFRAPGTVLRATYAMSRGTRAMMRDDHPTAIAAFEEALALRSSMLPARSEEVARCRYALAHSVYVSGDVPRTKELLVEVVDVFKEVLPAEDNDLHISMNNLASAMRDTGEVDKALVVFGEVDSIMRETGSDKGYQLPMIMRNFAQCHLQVDPPNNGAAEAMLREVVEQRRANVPPGAFDDILADTLVDLTEYYIKWHPDDASKLEEARDWIEEALDQREGLLRELVGHAGVSDEGSQSEQYTINKLDNIRLQVESMIDKAKGEQGTEP